MHYRKETWVSPLLEVRPSPIQGNGLFARQAIRQGEIVTIVGGAVMTEAEFQAFQSNALRYNAIQIDEDKHLVEQPEITAALQGSMNHHCDSNVWMQDEVTLIARCDIEAGEELTVNYALFTTQPDWTLEQECNCGAENCRKTITGNDWKLKTVQERYKNHFSPFINARIER